MQDKSWVLIWELRELALNGSCREAMLEGGAVSILAALLAEEDMPAPAKANAAAALKVRDGTVKAERVGKTSAPIALCKDRERKARTDSWLLAQEARRW